MCQNIGKVAQIIGPVVDITFPSGTKLPNILDALVVKRPEGDLIMECQQHIGEDTVRAIAMDATEGLQRGAEVLATGKNISMPIGDQIKGRLFNVDGTPIDGISKMNTDDGYAIHRQPPRYEDLTTSAEVLFTGIKVIDLIEPGGGARRRPGTPREKGRCMSLIPEKESLTCEFKSDLKCLSDRDLIEAVVGMANGQGGEIYLGVEDDGRVTGLHEKHRFLDGLAAMIANRSQPALVVEVTALSSRGTPLAEFPCPRARSRWRPTRACSSAAACRPTASRSAYPISPTSSPAGRRASACST